MTTKFAGDRAGSQLVIEKSIWAVGETPLKGRTDSINALLPNYECVNCLDRLS